jgi:phosphopantothenoylcysteine decarboxylase/phosphopantothenate--cysteine ligase
VNETVQRALKGKSILLGVTGGIAAYKAAELTRLLFKAGADVHVVMTEAATRFITPLTLETLSQNPVHTDMWSLRGDSTIAHTEIAREVALAIVGRLAGGLADQLLLTLLMAGRMPVMLCPSMNVNMWDNPLVQRNLELLSGLDRYRILAPDSGWLACRVEGKGRLPDPSTIVEAAAKLLSPKDLAGRRVVITAGPTREWLDPVRFLSNPSTGRMGYALAQAAWQRGAEVHLVTGPTQLAAPTGPIVTRVDSAAEMQAAVHGACQSADLLVMAAAPADYRPASRHDQKQKKEAGPKALALERTADILSSLTGSSRPRVVVGFAAETEDLLANAADKARRKGLDFIFANRVGAAAEGSGFGVTTNAGVLLNGEGDVVAEVAQTSKAAVAHRILDAAAERIGA